jgi:TIGR03009 family protein
MSRMLKPAAAGLAISSLCLSFVAEIPAQSQGKKKAAVKQTQAVEDASADSGAGPGTGSGTASGAKSKTQAPPAATKSGQVPRPEVKAMEVDKIDPALEQVLKDWERNTSQFKKLTGEFSVFRYDQIFEVEKRAEGKFVHEAPDKGNYERLAVVIPPGEKSKKIGKDGTPYKLESHTPERWVCTGKEVIKIDVKEKTYDKMPIPPEAQGQNIIESQLPFLFGMKAEQAKKRYKMKLKKKTETEIWLEVIPRTAKDADNWIKATVIIDAEKYVPTAVRTFDTTDTETVHIFRNVEINKNRIFEANPFKPSLFGLKPVLNDKPATSPGERLTPPSNPKQSSNPTNKTRSATSTEGFDRSADVAEVPEKNKKTATATRSK